MKTHKTYEADDRMIALIRDNYNVLQTLGSFGISLGFGDKTVEEVCHEHQVDTRTFLAVVNYTLNGDRDEEQEALSVSTLLRYLKASHEYFLNYQLPTIREGLKNALGDHHVDQLILQLYDSYARAITQHMRYEEKMVFPYVEALLEGQYTGKYSVDTYSRHHRQESERLRELKSIILRYLPADSLHNHRLTAILYDIYNNEDWLRLHAEVEERFFMPAIRHLEQQSERNDVVERISQLITPSTADNESLSDREKEVIVAMVQGMTNKQIANHLNISPHTVMTHRRNIAAKLQIHSPAGLTIYAIVNNLVDISSLG